MTDQLNMIDPGIALEPEAIIAAALAAAEGTVIHRVALISGGHDSTVLAHRCREHYDELAFIDTGTALPGVRDFVESFAVWVGKPLTVYEHPDAYRELVLGGESWWTYFRRERRPGETLYDFVIRTTPDRKRGDGNGNAPQGFPGPGGGHRAAYTRLKERKIEQLIREVKERHGTGSRWDRVLLLSGARRHESRRRSMTQGLDGYRRRGAQLWTNPLNEWTNDRMNAYRATHAIPESDVAALMHRSGECNCGAYMQQGEIADVKVLFPDWYGSFVAPLEAEAREHGIPRCVWGERVDTNRPGARGFDFSGDRDAQLSLGEAQLCSDCELNYGLESPA